MKGDNMIRKTLSSALFCVLLSSSAVMAAGTAAPTADPYAGNIGKYRIYCRYPLYTPAGEFLGTAGFELRFERILQPLLRANTVDPAHELYFVDSHRSVVTVQDRKFAAAAPGEPLPGPLSADEVLELADRLQENQLLQFETEIGGKTYFVSGDSVNLVNGLLIQLIECETMANHVHKE